MCWIKLVGFSKSVQINLMNSGKVWVQTVEGGYMGGGGTGLKNTCVKEMLPGGEGWSKQRWSVWTGREGDFFAVVILLGDVPGGSEASEL